MRSHTTSRFRDAFDALPEQVRRQARQAYRLFRQDRHHPSLRFKQVHPTRGVYSVRAGAAYRALGVQNGDEIVWFWIGSHADYDHLLSRI